MSSSTKDKQLRYNNLQKQLLSNYYSQQYQHILQQLPPPITSYTHTSIVQHNITHTNNTNNHRINFKNMILSRKQQNKAQGIANKNSRQYSEEKHKFKTEGFRVSEKEQQENHRIAQQLENSFIRELYQPSPSQLEKGNYNRLQVISSGNRNKSVYSSNVDGPDSSHFDQIEVTYEEVEEQNAPSQHRQEREKLTEGIRLNFSRRKEHAISPSPKKLSRVKKQSLRSSSINSEKKIESPQRPAKIRTPHRTRSNRVSQHKAPGVESMGQRSEHGQTAHHSRFQPEPDCPDSPESPHLPTGTFHPLENQQIEFVPPTNTQYLNANPDLVEESFKFQEKVRSEYGEGSEKASSIGSSRRSIGRLDIRRKSSQHSEVNSIHGSSHRASSKGDFSFISKLSNISARDGPLLREQLQKQLFQNQLGPYQSVLYGILDLMQELPRSKTVLAVGKKTLQDRHIFEQRRIQIQKQMQNYKIQTDKLQRKPLVKHLKSPLQQIKSNKLQILRLIRRLSITL